MSGTRHSTSVMRFSRSHSLIFSIGMRHPMIAPDFDACSLNEPILHGLQASWRKPRFLDLAQAPNCETL
jgi:hypothetical protein